MQPSIHLSLHPSILPSFHSSILINLFERQDDRDIFHLLVHSSVFLYSILCRAEPGLSQEPITPSRCPTCMAGTQTLGPFSSAVPRPLAGRWTGSGAASSYNPMWNVGVIGGNFTYWCYSAAPSISSFMN